MRLCVDKTILHFYTERMHTIEKLILEAIDAHATEIVAFADDILHHPELSDQEFRTAEKVAQALSALDLPVETGLSGTGVRARIGKGRPCVALIGELDALPCPGHPLADPVTGAAHACGHHAQLAAVYGAAIALAQPAVRAQLAGSVLCFAVPAEEREGGKCRLIREGAFDDVDIAVTHHTHYAQTGADLLLGSMRNNGVQMKRITITGHAAHAGGAPHNGVNALSAASLGMAAIGYLRETFRDEDGVRVHGIIAEGGAAQNVVPDHVVLEYGVRANNADALAEASAKVNRAFEAGAMAIGATARVEELFRYAPMRYHEATAWQREIAALLLPEAKIAEVRPEQFNAVSTDVGDLSEKLPVMNFTTGGFAGALHAADYRMEDAETALLLPARVMALSAYRLLRDGAREASALLA